MADSRQQVFSNLICFLLELACLERRQAVLKNGRLQILSNGFPEDMRWSILTLVGLSCPVGICMSTGHRKEGMATTASSGLHSKRGAIPKSRWLVTLGSARRSGESIDGLHNCPASDLGHIRFIAAEQPPHLACIAPWEGLGDYYRESICRGGIPDHAFWDLLFGWACGMTCTCTRLIILLTEDRTTKTRRRFSHG